MIIKIIDSLISFNKVAVGGILSLKLLNHASRFLIVFYDNSIHSNVASLKGGLFYFNLSEVHLLNIPMEELMEIFRFDFQNNSISKNMAEGTTVFFEGLDVVNQPETLIQKLKLKIPYSERNKMIGATSGISSAAFWDLSKEKLSSWFIMQRKVFYKVPLPPNKFYFCLAFTDNNNMNFETFRSEMELIISKSISIFIWPLFLDEKILAYVSLSLYKGLICSSYIFIPDFRIYRGSYFDIPINEFTSFISLLSLSERR